MFSNLGDKKFPPYSVLQLADSPDPTEEPEEKEDGIARGEGRRQTKHAVEGEGGNEAGASTNHIRETAPHVPSHHHPQEYDGIQNSFLRLVQPQHVPSSRLEKHNGFAFLILVGSSETSEYWGHSLLATWL